MCGPARLTNTYGYVLLQSLLDVLRGFDTSGAFTTFIEDLCRDNRTIITAAKETSKPVPIRTGLP